MSNLFAYYACKFAGSRLQAQETDIPPGSAHYPGDWNAENSNRPYEYPWGRKQRNPYFIGPFPQDKLESR